VPLSELCSSTTNYYSQDGLGIVTLLTTSRVRRQTEIENLRVSALGHKNVGRFDVAVNDSFTASPGPFEDAVIRSLGVHLTTAFGRRQLWDSYCSFAYSAFAEMRIGMSESASFQSVRKS
jgi:hypothetical protein